jgi:hypothetical protein
MKTTPAMSLEQAAEAILQGNPWLECSICHDGSQSRWFGVRGEDLKCPACAGTGYCPRKEYAEACRTLNREMPPRPVTRSGKKTLTARENKMTLRGLFKRLPRTRGPKT